MFHMLRIIWSFPHYQFATWIKIGKPNLFALKKNSNFSYSLLFILIFDQVSSICHYRPHPLDCYNRRSIEIAP